MKSDKAPLKVEQIEAQFRTQYPTYQYHFVEFFTEHLADCSRAFGGDLQLMLVLALMGQMHLQAIVAQKQNPDHWRNLCATRRSQPLALPMHRASRAKRFGASWQNLRNWVGWNRKALARGA